MNEAWRRFGAANLLRNEDFAVGQNYLEVCEQAHGECSEESNEAAAGIRRVLRGEVPEFSLEYPCHSPDEKRWFRLMVTPVTAGQLDGAVVMHVNITERRLMEDELRVSEERFRATFDQAAIGIANIALDGRYTRVNDKLCAILGFAREELLTMTFLEATAPEDRAAGAAAAAEMLSGQGTAFATEKRYRRKDGSIVWGNVTATLLRSARGEPQSFIVTCEDITMRKEAELRLRRLNRLHIVLSKTSEAVARAPARQELLDAVCQIVVADGHLRMAFIAEIEADGNNVRKTASAGSGLELLQKLPLSVNEGAISNGVVGTALRTGTPAVINDFVHEPRMAPWREAALAAGFLASAAFPIRPGGMTIGALVLCAGELNYFEEDEIRLMSAVAADLAFALEVQQKTAENLAAQEALRMQAHTLDHIGQSVIATDPAGVIFYANRAASELYGWPAAEMVGRSVIDVTVPTVSRAQAEEIVRRLQAGENWTGEFLVQTRGGRTFPAYVTDSPLLDASGKLVGIVGISSDMTERKNAADQLATERARAARSARGRACRQLGNGLADHGSDLVAGDVSHLRTDRRISRRPTQDVQEFVHPDDRARIDGAFKEGMGRAGEFALEHRLLFPDGRIKYVEERWRNIFDDEGKAVRVTGSCHDITERHLAAAALRRADESLRTTLETMTEVFVTIDREWRLTYINAEAERLAQRPRADLFGRILWEVSPALIGTTFEKQYRRAMEENASVSFEGYIEPRGLWLEERVYPSPDGLAIYARDITEFHAQREALRASEREFRTLAESMPQIVWAADVAGKGIYLNQNWLQLHGP